MSSPAAGARFRIDRYDLHDEIASGGMGTVHLGRVRAGAGLARIVAIKRLNPLYAKDAEFSKMFLDEARLAVRVRHPNVVPTLDVVEAGGELLLVMEYVHGESLARLVRSTRERDQLVSPAVAAAIMSGVLYGLHAAHEAVDERGEALGLVHRDVSPQNVLVGCDGIARVIDFGVAKAAGRLQTTSQGQLKGKLAYMAPEQLGGQPLDRRADVFAAGIVLWELLTGRRLFQGESEADTFRKVLLGEVVPPGAGRPDVPSALDAVVMKALSVQPTDRYSSAREMAAALLDACTPAPPHVVGEWVERCAHAALESRAERVAQLEASSIISRHDLAPFVFPTQPVVGNEASQVSSLSVSSSRDVAPPPKRRGSRAWLAAIGIIALTATAAGVWRLRTPADEGLAATTTASPPVAAPSSIDPQPAPPPSSAALPVAEGSAATPAPVASAEPTPAPSRRTWTPPRRGAGPSRSAPPNCDPPYVRAPDGTKIWKRECFQAR